MKYFVEVICYETDDVVKSIECSSERDADRVSYGLNINLNHEKYFTVIVFEDKESK